MRPARIWISRSVPPALQHFVVYGAAIPAYNATPEAALAFIRFMFEPGKGERAKAAGFDLLSSSN